MKRLFSIGFVALLVTIPAMAQSSGPLRGDNAVTRDAFVGAWHLLWLEEPDEKGNVHRADCTGLLVFTRDGHMSVQVMYRKAQTQQGGPMQYATGGYEASYGQFEVNDAHTFTYHVDGALVRTLVGKDLKRVYEFSGNQLIVKSPDPNEHWRVAWERD